MTACSESGQLLVDFTDNVGTPEHLVTNGAGEFTGRENEFVKEACRMRIILHTSDQGRKNQKPSSGARDWIPGKTLEGPHAQEESTKKAMGFRFSI